MLIISYLGVNLLAKGKKDKILKNYRYANGEMTFWGFIIITILKTGSSVFGGSLPFITCFSLILHVISEVRNFIILFFLIAGIT